MRSVKFGNFSELPSAPGVYLAIVGDQIVYVGRSNNLRRRWTATGARKHHQLERLHQMGCDRLQYRTTWTVAGCKDLEAKLINRHNPRLNGRVEQRVPWLMFLEQVGQGAFWTVAIAMVLAWAFRAELPKVEELGRAIVAPKVR